MTREQLKGSYSEGEAQTIYQEVKKEGNWLAFIKTYLYDEDYQVARNALWGLTKATSKELAFRMCKFYPELMDESIRTLESMYMEYYKPAVKSLRSRIVREKVTTL